MSLRERRSLTKLEDVLQLSYQRSKTNVKRKLKG
jgi:hypothetical protein